MTDRPARILIVDDERQNRQLLEVMLATEGFVLQTAASGEEALALVAQEAPDLILLDVMMPGMDGYQVAARIKGDVATSGISIIVLTALDDRNSMAHGLSTGADGFLTKPVEHAELRARVRAVLDQRGQEPSPDVSTRDSVPK
jgi:DNA-binding response OmpR family regulator